MHNTHNRKTSMPPGGIRTKNHSKWSAADLHLRQRGHWEGSFFPLKEGNSYAKCNRSIYPPLVILYTGYSFPPCLHLILLHFSQDRSNWSSPPFSVTTFENFPDISDLLSDLSKFQHHTKLCSRCSNLLESFVNLSAICWYKEPSSYSWMLLLPGQSWI